MKRGTYRTPFTLCLAFSFTVLSACGSEDQLTTDADTLCDAFDPTSLKNEYEGMWLSDVEKAIYENLEEDLETDEVKAVIADRGNIGNYADVYPFIKDGIEDVTSAPWSCQDMASFYEIDFVPASDSDQATANVLEIRQVEGFTFLIDDVEVDFSETQRAAAVIRDNFGEPETVTIRLSGENGDEMPKVLEVMTEIGVQNVKTVTPAG